MAITINNEQSATSKTLSYTPSSVTGACLVVVAGCEDVSAEDPITAVSFGGTAMTAAVNVGSLPDSFDAEQRVGIWYLEEPGTAAQTISVTGGEASRFCLKAFTLGGASQVGFEGAFGSKTWNTDLATSSHDVSATTSAADALAISAEQFLNGTTSNTVTGATQLTAVATSATALYVAHSTEAVAGTYTHTWSHSDSFDRGAIATAAFVETGGGGSVTGSGSSQASTATVSSTGVREVPGSALHQAVATTHSASGSVVSEITGVADHQAQGASHSSSSAREITGQSNHQAVTASQLSSGAVGNVVTGTAAHAANDGTHISVGVRIVGGTATHGAQRSGQSASGAVVEAITGSASHQAQRATSVAAGLRVITGNAAPQAATATQAATSSPGFDLPIGAPSVSVTTPVYSVTVTDCGYSTLDSTPMYSVSASG